MAKVVALEGQSLIGRAAFHDAFASAMGFFDGYGRNMDAWNDCMSSIDDPDGGMCEVNILPGEVLTLHIRDARILQRDGPEQWAWLLECSAFVNWRRIDTGEPPLLALAFYS